MRFDPAPVFAVSLIPYFFFLYWLRKSKALPILAQRGFQLTLLFVAVTIAAAIVASSCCNAQLVDIDVLHGGAEAFLTLANTVLVIGLLADHQQKE
ncbi:DUF3593 domain-containing protein [Synechococcus sp. M16CYN]|uniref:DUF3593 domain-containing protein n=1 Tax=Synechococcus sp. M16CYN TaxID=3103139 RepID=UPI00324E82EA